MQGSQLLYILFAVLGIGTIIVTVIVLRQDWYKKHHTQKS